jgi:hypothetical protein
MNHKNIQNWLKQERYTEKFVKFFNNNLMCNVELSKITVLAPLPPKPDSWVRI